MAEIQAAEEKWVSLPGWLAASVCCADREVSGQRLERCWDLRVGSGDQGQGRASKKCLGGSTEGRAGLGYTKKQTTGWGQLFSQLHPEKVAWGYNSPISPDGTAIRRSESPRGAFHAPWRWVFAVLGDLGFTLRHQCHNANRLKAAIPRVTPNPVIQWSPQQLSFGWRKREVQSKNGEKFFPWKTPVWVETFPTLDSPQKKARNGTAT